MKIIPLSTDSTHGMLAEILRNIQPNDPKNYEAISTDVEPTDETHPNDIVIQGKYEDNRTLTGIAEEIQRRIQVSNNVTKEANHKYLVIREKSKRS